MAFTVLILSCRSPPHLLWPLLPTSLWPPVSLILGSRATQYTVVISPPVTLENLLVVPLKFSILSRSAAEEGRAAAEELPTDASSTLRDPITKKELGALQRGDEMEFHQFHALWPVELTAFLAGVLGTRFPQECNPTATSVAIGGASDCRQVASHPTAPRWLPRRLPRRLCTHDR